MGHKQY